MVLVRTICGPGPLTRLPISFTPCSMLHPLPCSEGLRRTGASGPIGLHGSHAGNMQA